MPISSCEKSAHGREREREAKPIIFLEKVLPKNPKAQSAMEYLMTYGWAILIIAVVLGALFQLGVFNAGTFAPRAPPGACQVFRPNGPNTASLVNLEGVCSGELPQYVASLSSSGVIIVSPVPSQLEPLQVSIAVWFEEQSYDSCYPTEGAGVTYTQGYLLLQTCSGNLGVTIGSGTEKYVNINSGLPSTGKWHQEVATFDGTNIALYIDGQQVNTGTSAAMTYSGVTQFLVASGASPGLFEANLQVYNTSLSSSEVSALYAEGIGGAPLKLQNLVGWWPLNGNANDYSGNNNNGVPSGVTYTSQWTSGYTTP